MVALFTVFRVRFGASQAYANAYGNEQGENNSGSTNDADNEEVAADAFDRLGAVPVRGDPVPTNLARESAVGEVFDAFEFGDGLLRDLVGFGDASNEGEDLLLHHVARSNLGWGERKGG